MLTRILTSDMPESERRRFKIVRLDSGAGLPGWPLEANADTGHVVVRHEVPNCPAEDKWYEFGPNGLAIVGRLLALVVAIGFAASLSACAGLGGTAPPPQPTPAGIEAAVQQIAAISADPAAAWQAGDYAVRAACDGYLNDLAQRQAGFGLASGAVGTSGLAAAGIAASRANPVAAALATSAAALAQTFLGQLQNAGALPYSAETTALIQDALDAYERAVRPPQSLAEAAGDVEGLWWNCSPAGYAELAAKSIGSAQVSAAAMPAEPAPDAALSGAEGAAMPPISPGRPRVLVNGR